MVRVCLYARISWHTACALPGSFPRSIVVFFMPFAVPMWLFGLLAIAMLGGGAYVFYQWAIGALVGTVYLVSSVALLVMSFLGRPLVLWLFRRPGHDEPDHQRGGEVRRIARPDGTQLRVELYGPVGAPVLLMTHGWGTNSTLWYYAKRHLADRYRLVLWDLPGLGESTQPRDRDFALEKMAADLEAILDEVAEGPVTLVGHSIGGMISLTFCRLFPGHLGSRVAGLVLVDTTHTKPTRTAPLSGLMRALEKPLFVPLLYLTILLSPLVWLMNWLSYFNGTSHLFTMFSGFAGQETRGQLDFATRFTPMASPAVLARGMLAMLNYDESATLRTIPIPTLVVAGDTDRLTVPEASEHMSREIPAARLALLRQAGHMALLDHHDELHAAISQILRPTTAATVAEPPLRHTA
jgi:pimeloyl-ACP methyl ester carboxylesterase